MKNTSHSVSTNASLTIPDISRLLTEIGDLVFTRNQLEADQELSRRAMHEACEPVKAPFVADQEQMATVIEKLAVSIDARAEIIEEWCLTHKDEQFQPGQRTSVAGGMIYGFRLSNPRVEELPPSTRWQRTLHALSWQMDLDALERVVCDCVINKVPVFVKQDSGSRPGKQGRIPDGTWGYKRVPCL